MPENHQASRLADMCQPAPIQHPPARPPTGPLLTESSTGQRVIILATETRTEMVEETMENLKTILRMTNLRTSPMTISPQI